MPSFHRSSWWNKKPDRSDQEQPPKLGLTTDLDLASGFLCFGPENNDKRFRATGQCYSHKQACSLPEFTSSGFGPALTRGLCCIIVQGTLYSLVLYAQST